MNPTAVTVEGKIRPDGTLELPQKLDLPAGPVKVTVQTIEQHVQPERFWRFMESIWAENRAENRIPRTREEIDAELATLRNEAEEESLAVECLQERSWAEKERALMGETPT